MKIDFSKVDLKTLACIIFETLKKSDIDAVLVGGACISIYTQNQYQSFGLDFVTYETLKRVEQVLNPIGFERNGRYFVHQSCPYMIDFVNPPVAVGNQPIHEFKKIKTTSGSLQLLTPTDCVKDRLAAYFHWDDLQSLEQAILVAKKHKINLLDIQNWSEEEQRLTKFKEFQKRIL